MDISHQAHDSKYLIEGTISILNALEPTKSNCRGSLDLQSLAITNNARDEGRIDELANEEQQQALDSISQSAPSVPNSSSSQGQKNGFLIKNLERVSDGNIINLDHDDFCLLSELAEDTNCQQLETPSHRNSVDSQLDHQQRENHLQSNAEIEEQRQALDSMSQSTPSAPNSSSSQGQKNGFLITNLERVSDRNIINLDHDDFCLLSELAEDTNCQQLETPSHRNSVDSRLDHQQRENHLQSNAEIEEQRQALDSMSQSTPSAPNSSPSQGQTNSQSGYVSASYFQK